MALARHIRTSNTVSMPQDNFDTGCIPECTTRSCSRAVLLLVLWFDLMSCREAQTQQSSKHGAGADCRSEMISNIQIEPS